MPAESGMWSRRDSWPPTQVRLKPTVSTKEDPLPSLDDIDDDPLTYFLTPAPEMDDDDDDDVDAIMMDFDAGIQDANKPREIVRSVSPSTLDGLRKPGLRPVSPDTGSDITADDDEDNEDYVRFSPGRDSLLTMHDIFGEGSSSRPRSPAFGQSSNINSSGHLSPSLRGRTRAHHGPAARGNGMTLRRRPGQLWREPSPDVWSIEEETEEDVGLTDAESSVAARSDHGNGDEEPRKTPRRVRFVLPPTTHQ